MRIYRHRGLDGMKVADGGFTKAQMSAASSWRRNGIGDMEKCFYIEGRYLYLDRVLVEYNGIPIYFLCRDGSQYYTALCTDTDEWKYIVTRTAARDVYGLLHGRIPMRDVILRADHCWQVAPAEDMLLDDVKQLRMDEADCSLLPEAGACLEVPAENDTGDWTG